MASAGDDLPPPDEAPEEDPTATAAAATSPDGWAAAYDPSSQKWYYYNSITNQTQWDPPSSWVPNEEGAAANAPTATATAAAETAPAWRGPGFYYTDAHGVDQGPFTKEQLVGWRGALPMDLPVWLEESDPAGVKEVEKGDGAVSGRSIDGEDEDEEKKEEGEEEKGDGAPTAGGPSMEQQRELIPLAVVLGDAALLSEWRAENPEAAATPCAAPSAAAFERILAGGTAASLAEAVVAGLPATDEAAALARAAAAQGHSIHDVVQWNRAQAPAPDYTATAMHQGRMGKLTAAGQRESIYADLGRYMDPTTMEAQMKAAQERGKRKLTPAEVAEARRRKKAKKEERMKSWLLAD